MRELLWMAHGKSFSEWIQTASIESTLANTVRDPRVHKKPYRMSEFHPHLLAVANERKNGTSDGLPVTILKSVFVDQTSYGKIVVDHNL